MQIYSFKNDYSEGAHPQILEALKQNNDDQVEGYGEDKYCLEAERLIKTKINNPNARVHFVSGGTQANLIVISSILKPYESVIAACTGHIAVHEAGAIEATGHKVNVVETPDGKLTVNDIDAVIKAHPDEHMVKPKMVFVSDSTEVGTVYTKQELTEISNFCSSHDLILYLDGARLGAALTSEMNDLALPEISSLVDVFYIGGTKNGALFGEAIVINNPALQENFRFHLKQKGALLAKGRALGVQFRELFKDNLYLELAAHANDMAQKLAKGLEQNKVSFLAKPASNQIFPILDNSLIAKLEDKYGFYVWVKIDENKSAIRLVTSWATKEEFVDKFIEEVKKFSSNSNG